MAANEKPKLYIIRKYVMARTVLEAAKLEKRTAVHDIYIDEKWQDKHLAEAIGFTIEHNEE